MASTLEQRCEQSYRRRERRRKILAEAKDVSCADCGIKYPPYVMTFHHRDPRTKINNVANMVSEGIERLLAEIAKCDVLCANCHAEREFGPYA